jgi:hypothetical protein
MSKSISLSIENPCAEQWSKFTPTANGGFCSSCSKNVIDFTKMSDDDVLAFFTSKPANTCGRLRSDQLKDYSYKTAPTFSPGLALLKAGFLSILFALVSNESSAHGMPLQKIPSVYIHNTEHLHISEPRVVSAERIVTGIVRGEGSEPMAGVNIYLKGSVDGTVTDADGKFEFPRKLKEGDVLVFSFIGFETIEYLITSETTAPIEITFSAAYYEIMGKIAVVDYIYTERESGLRRWWEKVKDIF